MSLLQIQNLHKTYQQGHTKIPVLKGIDLQVNQGETIAIIGPSGSGKTTLLSLLVGIETPTQGQILFQNHIISQMKEKELAEFRATHFGIVFQQFHLLPHLTALENVALPLEILKIPQAEQKAKLLLERVGLAHRPDHFPSQLSGGECQRVAIARALVHHPTLLIADEPTGNLDQKTANQVMQLLFELVKQEKKTLILVTHNLHQAQLCQKQYELQDGVIKNVMGQARTQRFIS